MKNLKIAFCLDKKIGDSLVGLLLANQLAEYGFNISIYSDILTQISTWIKPHFNRFEKSPKNVDDLLEIHKQYDVVIVYHYPDLAKELDCKQGVFEELRHLIYLTPWGCKEKLPKPKLHHLSHSVMHQLARYNGLCFAEKSFTPYQYVENLCYQAQLPIYQLITPATSQHKNNLKYRKFLNRVLIHPTASTRKHSWAPLKFVRLAQLLKNSGFEPVFILHSSELEEWNQYLKNDYEYVSLSLEKLADYVYESGFAICNASGIGHLCSYLKIPTLTINVNRSFAYKKWAPFFWKNKIVTHEKWMPASLAACNTHRRTLISANKVFQSFLTLNAENNNYLSSEYSLKN